LNQNYSFFLSKKSEKVLLNTFVDTENLRKYLVSFQILLTESFFLVGMIFILLYINFTIFLYLFSIFFFIFILYFKTFKIKIERWSKDANDNIAISQNLLIEGVRGIKDLIIYGLSNFFLERFEKSVESESRANYKLEFLNIVSKYWIEVLVVFAISSCLIFIIILNNSIDRYLPIFTLFAVAIFRIVPTMNRLLANYQIAKFYKSSLDGVHDSLFSSSDYTINNDTNNIVFDKSIEFRKVSYSYNRDSKFILNNIDFKILKKEKVCILGKNGSGKSTLLNLISGLLSPTSGEIYIDSFNLLKINNRCWFKNISHVHQDVFLLNNTIKNNIILSHGIEYNESKFNMVTDLLSLNSLFVNLSDGLNTRVGDAGSALSGGQKQLISLARALYKDSDILILDEPTSALDINYISVFKNLLVKLENKTIIIVTHDKSLDNQYFDKIFEIKNGQLNLTYVKK
jgi:ATP-binding cassette subfamily C protein